MRILLILLLSLRATAAINLPTTPLTAPISGANTADLGTSSFTVVGRVSGVANNGQSQQVASIGGFGFLFGNASYAFAIADTINPPGGCSPQTAGGSTSYTDLTFMVVRNLATGKVIGAVFDTPTGAALTRCTYAIVSAASDATIRSAQIKVGDGTVNTSEVFGYLRWYNTAMDPSQIPHPYVSSPAPWVDYKFATGATAVDSSPFAQTLSSANTFVHPPTGPPVCAPSQFLSVTDGTTMNLSAGGLDAGGSYANNEFATLTYAWSNAGVGSDGVTQAASYGTPSARTTTATGLTNFGSFNTQLQITDSTPTTTTCVAHNGVVKANSAGLIDEVAENLTTVQRYIVGPLAAWGTTNWPYGDTAAQNEVNLQLSLLTTGGLYEPYWRTLSSGTITLTANNSTVIGSGTAFKSLFCSGGTVSDGSLMIWRYTGTDGYTHYNWFGIDHCIDDTQVVITIPQNPTVFLYPISPYAPWPTCSPTCSGLAFGRVDPNSSIPAYMWTQINAPGNYYDNTEAALIGYWRSGIDLFYTMAQKVATYWLELPTLDFFSSCDIFQNNFSPGSSHGCFGESRSIALTGMILWQQMSGNSGLLSSLEHVGSTYNYAVSTQIPAAMSATGGSILERDNAYDISGLALMALIESGATKTTYQTTIQNFLTPLTAAKKTTGAIPGWFNLYYSGNSTPNSGGYVHVTNGSSTVQGVGTSFATDMLGAPVWTWPGTSLPTYGISGGDDISYLVVAMDTGAQTLTIYPPYQGSTCTGGCQRGLLYEKSSGIPGWGLQPFMAGLFAQALFHASKAMEGFDPVSKTSYVASAHTVITEFVSAITPDQGGVYNGAYFPGCNPPMYNTTFGTQAYCYGSISFFAGGIWDSTINYSTTSDCYSGAWQGTQCVIYNNQEYVSLQTPNLNHQPDISPTYWKVQRNIVGPGSTRQISNEGMRALVYDFQENGTNYATGLMLQNQLYAYPGQAGSDGYYLDGYDLTTSPIPGYYVCYGYPGIPNSLNYCAGFGPNTPAKWAGQLSGFSEGAATWAGLFAAQATVPSVVTGGKVGSFGKVSIP